MVRFLALKGFYEVERTIGCGGFAKVKLATHLATGEKVAIKIMDKALLGADLARVKLEISALKTVSHENICKLYEVIETETHMFIVMEYCSGGELFDHIVEKNRLTESESRMFFRQIVSAVAYLHSLGYAHRDLKPENILLDKHQNLKLIDFGLCAKPDGGMQNPLYTSCGSPTYAAPELVQGKQYLGTEVDVWAMGVLLYTLLAGALPFDDTNIDSLYKKILEGRYEEPSFLSLESLKLIRSMLQVDPKKRITVNDLLNHQWLTLGVLEPVQIVCQSSKNIYQRECVEVMASHYQLESRTMWHYLKKWKYDYHTATYLLLLSKKKKKGSNLKLNNISRKTFIDINNECTLMKRQVVRRLNNSPAKISSPCNDNSQCQDLKLTCSRRQMNSYRTNIPNKTNKNFTEPHRPSIRKPYKRIRSPGPDDNSPVPAKKMSTDSTPISTPDSFILRGKLEPSPKQNLGECSFELHICFLPDLSVNAHQSTTTKQNKTTTPNKSILKKAVSSSPLNTRRNKENQTNGFVGIRRKRLRGDSWCYKKVCEEVLALTSKEFAAFSESAV
ncbi:maternal embryonic leucine zipper kinase-like isoform X2 [Diabrotica undecimpunctata]|uniref:maternal embryonic leucine zipper kinase-like isoform X2 n=1 Tax=Diabrotica undecimpunctata TaxID=50387 RepID=UPI003B63E32B